MRVGRDGRVENLFARGVGAPVFDIVLQRAGKEHALLEHDADLLAQRVGGDRADVRSIHQHRSRGDVIETREQVDDRALAGTAGADDRHHLARRDDKADVGQRPRAALARQLEIVVESDVAELDVPVQQRQRACRRQIGHLGLGIEHREDIFEAGARALENRTQVHEAHDGRKDERDVGVERDERAHLHVSLHHEPAAEAEHDQRAERAEHVGDDGELGVAQDDAGIVEVVGVDAAGKRRYLVVFLREGLHHAGRGDALVEEAHDLVPVVAMRAAFLAHALAMIQVVDDEQGQHRRDRERQTPLDPVKEAEHAQHRHRVRDDIDEKAVGQAVDLAGVLRDAADGAAGLIGVEIAQGKALQMGEKLDAQVAHDAHRGELEDPVAQ